MILSWLSFSHVLTMYPFYQNHASIVLDYTCNETAILTMAVVTVMWGSSANGDACLWVTIV